MKEKVNRRSKKKGRLTLMVTNSVIRTLMETTMLTENVKETMMRLHLMRGRVTPITRVMATKKH